MYGLVELRIPLSVIKDYCELTGRYTQEERRKLVDLIPVLDDVYLAWRSKPKKGESESEKT